MIKFKNNDWVLTTSGCIVQVLHIDRGDYMVGVRIDANDVMRPLSKHAIVKVVPDPKKLLEAPLKLLKEVNNLHQFQLQRKGDHQEDLRSLQ